MPSVKLFSDSRESNAFLMAFSANKSRMVTKDLGKPGAQI